MKLSNAIFFFGILLALIPLNGMESFKGLMAITLQLDADNLSTNELTIKPLSTTRSFVLKPKTVENIFEISIPLAQLNNNEHSHFERLELTHVGIRKYLINLSKKRYSNSLCAELVGLYSSKPPSHIAFDSTQLDKKSKLVFVMDGGGSIDRIDFLSLES